MRSILILVVVFALLASIGPILIFTGQTKSAHYDPYDPYGDIHHAKTSGTIACSDRSELAKVKELAAPSRTALIPAFIHGVTHGCTILDEDTDVEIEQRSYPFLCVRYDHDKPCLWIPREQIKVWIPNQ